MRLSCPIRAVVFAVFCLVATAACQAALLNTVAGAQAAYSLRLLNDAYSGSAIEVRRGSDSTTMNIGFDANGRLDTTALLNFVGSGDGYVVTWFDQAGGSTACNVTQSSTALQPQIVAGGSVLTDPVNHLPALRFNSDSLQYTGGMAAEAMSIFTAGSWISLPSGTNSNAQRLWTMRMDNSSRAAAGGDYGSGAPRFAASYGTPGHTLAVGTTPIVAYQPFVQCYLLDASPTGNNDFMRLYVDGELAVSRTGLNVTIADANYFNIGSQTTGERYYNGLMQELIVYHEALPEAARMQVEGNMMWLYAPEPGSALMLLLGGLLVGVARGRRRRRAG
ncbi:MAG: LamG-like jellyroll fold domain-containing protein [Patescibacteria group bacterium]|nr:LamG-like jellyroll fold domain-containing protein [Patescibacteria group bacterium]